MIKYNNKEELMDYLDSRMKEFGTYEVCKKCAEISGGCCVSSNCEFYTENGCINKKVTCALSLCSKLRCKFPELEEEFENINKYIKRETIVIFPVEVKNG